MNYTFNQIEIETVWKRTKNKRYSIQSFLNNGNYVEYAIFEDMQAGGMCTGKIVTKFLEGEVYHWPRLHHSSLAPLLDVIFIDERLSIYMTTHLTITLRDAIHDNTFVDDPLSFGRKKAYIEDVLFGVDYIHSKRLSLMNISDANVLICSETDRAVITNFSCLVTVHKAENHKKCAPYMYRAPELSSVAVFDKKNNFDPIYADIWSVGVMIMEIFLNHTVPWGIVDYDPSRSLEIVNKLDSSMLKVANKGSSITNKDINDLKKFISLFLNADPKRRCKAREAVLKKFIQNGKYRMNGERGNIITVGNSDKTEFNFYSSIGTSESEFNESIMSISNSGKQNLNSLKNEDPRSSNTINTFHKKISVSDPNVTYSKIKNAQDMTTIENSGYLNMTDGERSYCQNKTKSKITSALRKASHEVHKTINKARNQFVRLNEIPDDYFSELGNAPKINIHHQLDSLKIDDTASNSNSYYENNYAIKRHSMVEPTTINHSVKNSNCNQISAPVLQTLSHKSNLGDLRHDTKKTLEYVQNVVLDNGSRLDSNITDNIKYNTVCGGDGIIKLVDEDTQMRREKLIRENIYGHESIFKQASACQDKNTSFRSIIVDQENDFVNDSNGYKSSISYKENNRCLLSANESDFVRDISQKTQDLNEIKHEKEDFNSMDFNLVSDLNFVFSEPVLEPRQIIVTKHKRCCPHLNPKLNKKKKKINGKLCPKQANATNEDYFGSNCICKKAKNVSKEDDNIPNQTCEKSDYIVNESKTIDDDTDDSGLQLQLQTNFKNVSKDESKKEKKKKDTFFCFRWK